MLKQLWSNIVCSHIPRSPKIIRGPGNSYLTDQYYFAQSNAILNSGGDHTVQIFIHIPKSAGTTLCWIAKALCIRYGLTLHRSKGAWDTSILSGIPKSALQQLYVFPKDQLQTQDFVTGHFPFGIHELLSRRSTYVTIVREPVSHAVSYYNFLVMKNVIDSKRRFPDLIEKKEIIDNPQVRQLCGESSLSGRCNEAVLQCAKRNLEKYFSIVGITDRFNDFVRCWLSMNNWPSVAYPVVQVTGKKKIQAVHESLRIRLQEYNKFDCDLYNYAAARFATQFSQYQASFQREVNPSGDNEVIIIPLDFAQSNQIEVIDEGSFLREKIRTLRITADVE